MADDDLLIERLLRVIDEGRWTATYKLALLLGIVEAAALSPGSEAWASPRWADGGYDAWG